MMDWMNKLNARERRFVTLGGIAAIAILLLGILLPLNSSVSKANQRIEQKRADLAFMQGAAPEVASAGPPIAGGTNGQSLVVLVDTSARESGLGASLNSSQPSGDKALRVRFERASFDLMVGWLARLAQQHGVNVESAEIEGAGEPGLVNASLVLRSS
jgi:type II secretory pathway component PulM